MKCQPDDGQGLGTLSGPCFVDRHDECEEWLDELWVPRGCLPKECSCQRHQPASVEVLPR